MAPRRGGYGGSSIGGGIQSCKDNDAFDSPYTIALMAFIAFFFLVFLAQTWSVFRCKRNNNGGWFILAGSTILMFIGVIIKLVIIPTYECGSMTTADYNATSIAISWLIGYASLLLVATIMVPVCRIATQGSKLIRILNTAYIVFLSLLWAITLAIATKLTVDDDDYYGYSSYNLQRALNGLIIARGIFMVIGVLIAGLVIIVQTLRKSHLRKGVSVYPSLINNPRLP
ncbi:hypothetical protein BDV59DRAFT_173603 [Aspergillus ambiguus]|uniref:uncharacterized protein n=1 Tax=Aspergillus ambiguus TaxID=176160 RepID=UPI003CCCCDD7